MYKAMQQIKSGSGTTIGYILLNDKTGESIKLKNQDIKDAILNKKIGVYNLRVTQDGKLIHVESLDREGLMVTPQEFFSGKAEDWTLEPANNGSNMFRATHKSGKSFVLNYSLYNGNRAYYIKLHNDEAILGKEQYSDIIYRDMGHATKSLAESLNKLLTRKITSREQIDRNEMRELHHLRWRKENLEEEYRHGCSEDSEDAFYTLQELERLEKKYKNNAQFQKLCEDMSNMTNGEKIAYLNNFVNDKLEENQQKQKGTPSEYPGIIYETSARTKREYLNSLQYNLSDGIHAYNSMEYWWSLDPEEREAEIHDPNSPWYNFEG